MNNVCPLSEHITKIGQQPNGYSAGIRKSLTRKEEFPRAKTCILTKTYFLPHIPADNYGRYLYLFRFKRYMSRSILQTTNSY